MSDRANHHFDQMVQTCRDAANFSLKGAKLRNVPFFLLNSLDWPLRISVQTHMFSIFSLNDPGERHVFFEPSAAGDNFDETFAFLRHNSPDVTAFNAHGNFDGAPVAATATSSRFRRQPNTKKSSPTWSALVKDVYPDTVDGQSIWDNIASLNMTSPPKPIALPWSRACKTCGIKILQHARHQTKACFVCGPNGAHNLPALPPYPPEWDVFLTDKHLSSLSRKLNNIFTLTALGVSDGDFVKFPSGLSSVTWTAGGRTIGLFLMLRANADIQQILSGWVDTVLRGLRRVNPFVNSLENMAEDPTHTLILDRPDNISGNEVAAIISFAPAAKPTRRQIVIKQDGEHQFLDILSPLTEPMHYILLFPDGILGWAPDRLNGAGNKFSQM
ncbi:hypothetical protein B0H12DRAFT_1076858 [Mycena haematopus]|nr:hypothetical protein B0H12DRAFT_1076858 [Mycena haematopus]